MRRLGKSEGTRLEKSWRPYHHGRSKCVRDMNEPKSNKVGINDTNELDEEKIVAHTLHLHYRPSGIEAQQTKNTNRAHSCRRRKAVTACLLHPLW